VKSILKTTLKIGYDDDSSYSVSRINRNSTDDQLVDLTQAIVPLQDRNLKKINKIVRSEFFHSA